MLLLKKIKLLLLEALKINIIIIIKTQNNKLDYLNQLDIKELIQVKFNESY